MHRFTSKGFTIVELLIVVVVIGILAAISMVAYIGITQSADKAALASELTQAEKSLEIYKVNNEVYPEEAEIDGILGADFGSGNVSYNVSEDRKLYCLQAQKGIFSFFITNTLTTPTQGYCEGTTGVESEEAPGEPEGPVAPGFTSNGDGGGLAVIINDAWNEIIISWDPVEGALRYRIQIDKGDGNWIYVNRLTGHPNYGSYWSCATAESTNDCSGRIPSPTTSVTWNYNGNIPYSVDQAYKFRLQAVTEGGVQSGNIVTLQTQTPYPGIVKNFKMQPSGIDAFNQYILSWDPVVNTNIPNHRYEIQVNRGDDNWVYVNRHTGHQNYGSSPGWSCASANSAYSDCSTNISGGSDSVNWSDVYSRMANHDIPYSYRIRLASNISGLYSGWQEYTYNPPAISERAVPANFSVNGAAPLQLSWTNPEVKNVPNPHIQIQVKKGEADWVYVNRLTGRNTYGSATQYSCNNPQYSDCSGRIPIATDSLSWSHNDSTPPIGSTYQYRIRYNSTTVANYYSNWATFSYTR